MIIDKINNCIYLLGYSWPCEPHFDRNESVKPFESNWIVKPFESNWIVKLFIYKNEIMKYFDRNKTETIWLELNSETWYDNEIMKYS